MNKNLKIEKEEQEVCEKFFNNLKNTLTKAHNLKDEESDFETFKFILKESAKPPTEFFKIFLFIPEQSRKAILKYLGYKTEKAFKTNFAKQINIYRQSVYRREKKLNKKEFEGENE
jgi:hydroxyacyl-ACP dehydratase HTD2-like protein with hotdog domain